MSVTQGFAGGTDEGRVPAWNLGSATADLSQGIHLSLVFQLGTTVLILLRTSPTSERCRFETKVIHLQLNADAV